MNHFIYFQKREFWSGSTKIMRVSFVVQQVSNIVILKQYRIFYFVGVRSIHTRKLKGEVQ